MEGRKKKETERQREREGEGGAERKEIIKEIIQENC